MCQKFDVNMTFSISASREFENSGMDATVIS